MLMPMPMPMPMPRSPNDPFKYEKRIVFKYEKCVFSNTNNKCLNKCSRGIFSFQIR